MIAIVDYGLGNLYSIQNMLKHIEIDSVITADKEKIKAADKLILPGVGKFDEGMKNLQESGLDTVIKDEAATGKAILGICLGMQLLGKASEEGERGGLGLIDFKTVLFRLEKESGLKIPHMGWERVKFKDSPLMSGTDDKQRYYFVHSYHAKCEKEDTVIISCVYGYEFAAGVRNGRIYGVQFHPEKSHKYGMKLLENFARNC